MIKLLIRKTKLLPSRIISERSPAQLCHFCLTPMMSHHMSNLCETLSCSLDFYDTLSFMNTRSNYSLQYWCDDVGISSIVDVLKLYYKVLKDPDHNHNFLRTFYGPSDFKFLANFYWAGNRFLSRLSDLKIHYNPGLLIHAKFILIYHNSLNVFFINDVLENYTRERFPPGPIL